MPAISMFYGIVIRMYSEPNSRHKLPHIHAEYQGEEAVITLDGEVIEGAISAKKLKLVIAWIEIHSDELYANWQLLSKGERAFTIEPLK